MPQWSALAQFGKAFAERGIVVEPRRRMERRAKDFRIGIPCALMANPLEARAGGHQRVEHFTRLCAQAQVGMADDRIAQADIAIEAAGALGGDAVDVLDLTDDLEGIVCSGAVKGAAFHEDRADHVVPAGGIGMEFVEGVIG